MLKNQITKLFIRGYAYKLTLIICMACVEGQVGAGVEADREAAVGTGAWGRADRGKDDVGGYSMDKIQERAERL